MVKEIRKWALRWDGDAATCILGLLAGYPGDSRTPLLVDAGTPPSDYDAMRVGSDTFRAHMA